MVHWYNHHENDKWANVSVKICVYDDLCLFSHQQAPVMDMLLAQIKKYYEPNEETCPPLRLEPCILSQGHNAGNLGYIIVTMRMTCSFSIKY